MEINALSRGVHNSDALNLPHRIPLPDGEQGQDRQLQLRVAYQQSELTRSAIQPPPNKSVQDVPDWAPPPPRKPPSPHKKDNLMQKAVKYLAKISGVKGAESTAHTGTVTGVETGEVAGAGGGGGTGTGTGTAEATRQAPCVMVPLRPPPAPAPPPPAPPAPPSPPHAPPS
ncbi:uncharacterized protein LOC143921601 [Arctopsyche grandis]|uniref:uncharacterized protein LOC143921601 n=1 Tax=Arctopsyche grandis TaxID=121162 RepID=UPI00406DA3C1